MKTWIYILIGVFIVLGSIFLLQDNSTTGNTISEGTQEITLSYGSGNYILSDNTVNAGEPVTITVDTNTVIGCYKSIIIPDLGIRKYITPTDNKITFTPTEPGVYTIRCSMGMATTKLTVV